MTPKDIVEELLRENQKYVDSGKAGEWIHMINVRVLETILQQVIDRSAHPVSNERIAKMANLLQANEKCATEARAILESLYYKKDHENS